MEPTRVTSLSLARDALKSPYDLRNVAGILQFAVSELEASRAAAEVRRTSDMKQLRFLEHVAASGPDTKGSEADAQRAPPAEASLETRLLNARMKVSARLRDRIDRVERALSFEAGHDPPGPAEDDTDAANRHAIELRRQFSRVSIRFDKAFGGGGEAGVARAMQAEADRTKDWLKRLERRVRALEDEDEDEDEGFDEDEEGARVGGSDDDDVPATRDDSPGGAKATPKNRGSVDSVRTPAGLRTPKTSHPRASPRSRRTSEKKGRKAKAAITAGRLDALEAQVRQLVEALADERKARERAEKRAREAERMARDEATKVREALQSLVNGVETASKQGLASASERVSSLERRVSDIDGGSEGGSLASRMSQASKQLRTHRDWITTNVRELASVREWMSRVRSLLRDERSNGQAAEALGAQVRSDLEVMRRQLHAKADRAELKNKANSIDMERLADLLNGGAHTSLTTRPLVGWKCVSCDRGILSLSTERSKKRANLRRFPNSPKSSVPAGGAFGYSARSTVSNIVRRIGSPPDTPVSMRRPLSMETTRPNSSPTLPRTGPRQSPPSGIRDGSQRDLPDVTEGAVLRGSPGTRPQNSFPTLPM